MPNDNMETTLPKTKVAESVPRALVGLKDFINSAIGGPPIEVDVPRKPDSTPANMVFGALTFGVQPKELSAIVNITAHPINNCSELVDKIASAHTANAVPGSRAILEYHTIFQSVSDQERCSVVQAMTKARHRTTTGTSSGFMSAMIGVEIVPSPKPMTPCTVEPMKMMSPKKM